MTVGELIRDITLALMAKSGVREWESSEQRLAISQAAVEMATAIISGLEDMTLPDSILLTVGNCVSFADHAGDFSPTAANALEHGTPIDGQLSLASVANNAARQSAKVDLTANRAPAYSVIAAFELAATPTAGNVIEVWWAPSPSGTAGTANPGNVSGSDAAYAGYSSNLDASIVQLQFIGDFVCTAQATGTIQVARVGILIPRFRYGSLVVYNKSGAAFHADDVECHVVMSPQLPQIQD